MQSLFSNNFQEFLNSFRTQTMRKKENIALASKQKHLSLRLARSKNLSEITSNKSLREKVKFKLRAIMKKSYKKSKNRWHQSIQCIDSIMIISKKLHQKLMFKDISNQKPPLTICKHQRNQRKCSAQTAL